MEFKLINVRSIPNIPDSYREGVRKWLLLMIMRTFIFLLCTTVFSFNVETTLGQEKVTIEVDKEVTVDEVFKIIIDQTKYRFLYPENLFKDAPKVQLKKGTIRVSKLLLESVSAARFNVILSADNTIVIKQKPITFSGIKDQQQQITGKVTDATGLPIPGVTVLIKGTAKGTVTELDGNYSIIVPNPENVLVFTALGFAKQEITVGNQTLINVTLKEKAEDLDEVILSANLSPSKSREVSSSVTVINSEVIEQLPFNNVAELFRGEVPGAVAWDYGPGSITSPIKLRGDFDFRTSASSVKVFIDGIEVAEASYLAALPLNMIEKVEILRGPQASSLYGSGSTSGVVFIYTKKGKYGGPHFNTKISTGIMASKYVDNTVYTQDHSVNILGASESISYNIGGSYFHNDAFWEDGDNTNTGTFGSVKINQGKFSAGLTGQYSTRKAGYPINPILKQFEDVVPTFGIPYNWDFTNTSQTLGLTMSYKPFEWWDNIVSVGIDETNNNIDQYEPRYSYATDTLNMQIYVKLKKKTFRYFTSLKLPIGKHITAGITAGVDNYNFDFSNKTYFGTGTGSTFIIAGTPSLSNQEYSNVGYFAQGVFGFFDKLFLTAGLRSETTKSYGVKSPASTSPKLGISYAIDLGELKLKPRASYGQSIKVPDPSYYEARTVVYSFGTYEYLANPDLKPQRQVGYDVGVDASFGNGKVSLEATYYNQKVDDFISSIFDSSNAPNYVIQYVNVGKITNTGFELSGKFNTKSVSLRFNYAITNSIAADVSDDYSYIYDDGDRIMGIPKSSGGATLTYTFPSLFKSNPNLGGSISFGTTYFGEKPNIDQIAYYKDVYGISGNPVGTQKDYIINYEDYFLCRLDASYNITRNMEVFININNLFNIEQFEYNNTYPNRGRHTVFGVKLNF